MSEVSWTKEQKQVIELRGRNILVSAAAGSGKTAVLVERIIGMITDETQPIDIDKLLIVTFTNAAAAEMRERIGAALEQALEKNPLNTHLQRQITLIHNAQITTIDSFCLYVIRNHFHEIDLEPDFRIGDEGELKLLQEDVLTKVLGDNYAAAQDGQKAGGEAFLRLADSYTSGKNDDALRAMILQLYDFSRSYPWPAQWLSGCVKGYEAQSVEELEETPWLRALTEHIRRTVLNLTELTAYAHELTLKPEGPFCYEPAIRSDLEKYKRLASCERFHEFAGELTQFTYDRLAGSRGYEGDLELLEQVKALREKGKETIKKLRAKYSFAPVPVMLERLLETGTAARELVRLTTEFSEAFAAEKRRKNLVDFHDLEHFALEILVDEETGLPKRTAQEFQDNFEEIMIDEYQDSNYVQETLLLAVSRERRGRNNLFMVGDVKQSIYRFRLARPELFMEKYGSYTLCDSDRQRIDLHKNFRSRGEVLSCTNDLFFRLMKQDLGNVEYDAAAALYEGARYPKAEWPGQFDTQVYLADSGGELLEDTDNPDKKLLEAKLVAVKIKELMESQKVTDAQTKKLRSLRYSDIVILLRSLSGFADAFAEVLNDSGIPAHTLSSTGYFSAVEVQTVLAMLRILDNPRQDIPLAAVLRSPMGNFTEEELARLRLCYRQESFHACVLKQCENLKQQQAQGDTDAWGALEHKLYNFYEMYLKLRKLVPDTPIHELIELLLKETGYGDYAAAMPGGNRRRANLEMLVEKAIAYEKTSYKGLFHFVRYIDELQKYDVDFGEADLTGENEDVVRIMSIHKSKGLEFPVVFVSGLGKNFNKQDTRSRMVLHPELGIGLDNLDAKRRLKSVSLAKCAIAKQIELENLGEEMRVLYVALTRAKEKLILTGCLKDAAEKLDAFRADAAAWNGKEALSYLERESASSYLDWILPVLCSYGEKYGVFVMGAAELTERELVARMQEELDEAECLRQIEGAKDTLVQQLEERFSARYPYAGNVQGKNKYSVSELKHYAMAKYDAISERPEQEEAVQLFEEPPLVPYVPSFVRKIEKLEETEEVSRGALRGTAVHRVMECYQFASKQGTAEQIQAMLAAGQISAEMKELVKIPLVERFVRSAAGERMRRAEQAKRLYREKPFVMGFTQEEMKSFGFEGSMGGLKDDLTLIQGIIDAFWLEEDGIVLLDYKTDHVDKEQELVDRYRAQMLLYSEALERVYGGKENHALRVKERFLYSFRLGSLIPVL